MYLVRERRHLWASAPSRWILAASAGDVLVVSLLASCGILMPAAPLPAIGTLLLLVVLDAAALDFLKVRIFRRFDVR